MVFLIQPHRNDLTYLLNYTSYQTAFES